MKRVFGSRQKRLRCHLNKYHAKHRNEKCITVYTITGANESWLQLGTDVEIGVLA